MAPLFSKKLPPLWYVLRPSRNPSDTPNREGPYSRATITAMFADGQLGDGALIWTNEKIFPNPRNPNSSRTIRIMEWRRLDEIPDPVYRQIEADARAAAALIAQQSQSQSQQLTPSYPLEHPDGTPPEALTAEQFAAHNHGNAPVPHSLPNADPDLSQPQQTAPAAYPQGALTNTDLSVYPVGTFTTPPDHHAPQGYPTPAQPPQPGAYPQPSAYPPPGAPPPPGHPL